MMGTPLNRISEYLAREYVRVFARSPVITSLATIVAIAIVVVAVKQDSARQAEAEKQRQSVTTYADQFARLDTVQQSLKNLSEFVIQQRGRLQESQQLIGNLQDERNRIEPLLQADRKVVDAVFQLQEQRSAHSVSRERWIGFGLGIGASVVASFIYAAIVFAWRRTKSPNDRNA